MHLEEFSDERFLRNIDPRAKIISFLLIGISIVFLKNFYSLLISIFIAILIIFIAGLNKKEILKRLFVVNIFIVFLFLTLPFNYKGEVIFKIGEFTYTKEGFLYTLKIFLKANSIVLFTIVFIGTIPVFKLSHALRHLKIPDKFVNLFFFTYRYITLLHEDYIKLINSIKLRGFIPKTNLYTYKTFSYIIGTLFFKSYIHSEEILKAMKLRGYTGQIPLYKHFKKIKRMDLFFVLATIIFIIFLFFIGSIK